MVDQKYKLGIRAIHQKDIKTAIVEAKQNGFDVLEIHFSSPQFIPEHYTPLQLSEIKALAEKNNIVLQTHSEIGESLIQASTIMRKAERARLQEMVQFSQKIGARCLTLHIGDAPGYHTGIESIHNDKLYAKHYAALLEDSVKYIVSIAPKNLSICIENDNLLGGYQNVLDKYLKTNKVFLTWDIMKSFTYQPKKEFHPDQWRFLRRNIDYVRNIHISGPKHAGLSGHETDFVKCFELLRGRDIPMVIEVLSLKDAIQTKKIIRNLGF